MPSHKFEALDGLRGVAALSVMAYHRRDWFGGDAFLGHAYLAVDFFFLLSGFVLAHAYGQRLVDNGNTGRFIRDRIVRLHPMLVAGAILATVVAILDAKQGGLPLHDPGTLALAHAVPFPILWGQLPAAFPWNIAIWSLFWELLANLMFALFASKLTYKVIYFVVGISVFTMIFVSISANGFQVGFARDLNQFIWGFPRVCASFFLGVLIYRRHRLNVARAVYLELICAVVLVITFSALRKGSEASAVYDLLIAYAIYPVLLLAAAKATPQLPRMTAWLGSVSYPLYIIHEPMLKVVGGTMTSMGISDGHPALPEAIFRLCIVVALAFVALKLYDEPVRSLLRRAFKRIECR